MLKIPLEDIMSTEKVKVPLMGKKVDGVDVNFKVKKEEWNEYELDLIQKVLIKTYDDNTSNELKQKHIEDRLKYQSSKKCKISKWKQQGIKSADWNSTYELWLNCKNCELCNAPFLDNRQKRLDHDHNIDHIHNIRWVVCCKCNNQADLKNYKNNNKSLTFHYILHKI